MGRMDQERIAIRPALLPFTPSIYERALCDAGFAG
jgi:hypothetical protein